jgi:N-glycosylase/DNA lyase
MNKLTIIKTNPEWLEATWVEETVTQIEIEKEIQIEKEVDGESVTITELVKEIEDRVETKVLWCESFSGHKEHITMLEDKCKEFETELTQEQLLVISGISEAFIPTPQEELDLIALKQKVDEAKAYLKNTDYKMTVDYFTNLSTEEQSVLTANRAECRTFIRNNKI